MKRFLIVAAVILLLIVAVGIGVRSYLRSHRVAQQVTAHLETLVGGPVRVDNVDVGLSSTAISGLALYEEGRDGEPDGLWLKINSLAVDVSLWDLVNGNALPKHVTIKGATLVLRFDRQGNLLTRLADLSGIDATEPAKAETLPAGILEKGEILFRKEGHPDLVAKNVAAQLKHDAGRLVLSGTADNVELGKLTINGALDSDTQKGTVQLKTEGKAHVTQAVLDRLPFVPAEVWQELRIAEGDTPAELTLRYERKAKNLQYRVELAPENTSLSIPAINLSVHAARGKATIEDNVVKIRAVEGQAFGGVMRTEADFDFRGHVTKLRFPKIEVQDVAVSDLPDNWNIPGPIRKIGPKGKLTATATLEVTIASRTVTARNASDLVVRLGAAYGSGQWFAPLRAFRLWAVVKCTHKVKGRAGYSARPLVLSQSISTGRSDRIHLQKPNRRLDFLAGHVVWSRWYG